MKRRDEDATAGRGVVAALMGYAGDCRWLVVAGCVLACASSILSFGFYLGIWGMFRNLFGAPSALFGPSLAVCVGFAAACAVASVAAYMAGLGCTHRAAFHVAAQIRKACCSHLLRVPLGFYQGVSAGDLQRKVDAGASLTEDVIAHKLPDVVGALTAPVAFVVLGFALDWRMGLACLIPFLVGFCLLGATMGKGMADAMDDYQAALDAMNAQAVEYVRGIPVVKVFQQTAYSLRRFHAAIVAYGNLAFGFAQIGRRPQVMYWIAASCSFVLLIPVASFAAAAAGADGAGAFAADFIFYAALCTATPAMLARIMSVGQSVMSARTAIGNVDAVLSAKPLRTREDPEPMRDASIVFDDVCFSYPGSRSLAVDHVSFEVKPGMKIALVGASGSGKSTCAALIPRFWDVCEGSVRVGGSDVRDLDPRELMENVAFVLQGGCLFNGTIMDNVRAARPDASRESALRALSAAQCDEMLERFALGADTPVGRGAAYLSGGERQRVLLARALLKDAAIVVLDEATAFADADNEARIQQAFGTLMEGRTVVMIAHRLSTVVDADQIVVLDRGRVVERGTHSELLDRAGRYSAMWDDYVRSTLWEIPARGAQVSDDRPAGDRVSGEQPGSEVDHVVR
ncbi:ABC transporter ATP-binding protein/permease [Slackia exigua]|uniref:ABC transporter ATP-binding protein n=1 Tax=Slackia exigua TaxID=84109 RepID=UPI003BA16903